MISFAAEVQPGARGESVSLQALLRILNKIRLTAAGARVAWVLRYLEASMRQAPTRHIVAGLADSCFGIGRPTTSDNPLE